MSLLGTPIFTIGAVDLKGDEGRKRVEEFIKNVDEKIRIVVANDVNLMQRFNDELNIIANKGFHFTLARRCTIPASREMEFMTANICESFGNCSFYLADKAPVGCACPFEIMYIKQLTEGFIESTNIDPENSFLDMQSLTEYVTYSLNFFRASRAMASSSIVMMSKEETKFGTNYTKSMSYYNEIMEMASRHMARIKKEMILTRESRVIYKMLDNKTDPKTEKEEKLADAYYSGESIDMIEQAEKNKWK